MSDLVAYYRNHSRGTVPCGTCENVIKQGDHCWVFQAGKTFVTFCSATCVENGTILKASGAPRRGTRRSQSAVALLRKRMKQGAA